MNRILTVGCWRQKRQSVEAYGGPGTGWVSASAGPTPGQVEIEEP